MGKTIKLLAIVLCMVLTVTLLPATAKAAGVEVGDVTELQNALESIGAGESITIELMATIDYPYSVYIDGKSVIFNLNTFHLNITGDSVTALSVYNGGSVSLSGEGELNVSGGSGVYGVVAYYGSNAEVTNATATSMSGYGAYAYGAGSSVIVRQAAAAVGSYSAGAYAEQGGSITVGSASGSGLLSRGADVYNGGTITVNGNAEADGEGSAGAYAYNNNGLPSSIAIGGSATAGGIDSYGAYAEGAGSSVATQTAGATGEGSIGAHALNGGAVTAGSATASGANSYGAYANLEGSVEVAAVASASGDTGCIGAYAKNGGSVTAGSAAAVSNNSTGAWADGVYNSMPSSVDVAGSATANGHTNCTGAYASGGAKVTVGSAKAEGITTADGLGIFGAKASGADSLVEVEQSSEAKGEGSIGAFAIDYGKVTALHATATGDYSCGASAGLNGIVQVSGNATSTGDGGNGVYVSDDGVVTVNGSVTASGQSCIGAYVNGSGTITIDGIITAQIYIYMGNEEKYPDDGVPGTAPYAGYSIYSSGPSTVRAKFYVSLMIKTNTLLPATTGAAYSDAIATSYTGTKPRTFSATGLPSGLFINASTGVISGTPAVGTDTASPYSVTVSVTDGTVSGQRSLSLEVYPGAAVPLIHPQPVSIARNIGQTATFTIGATATDGGNLFYQWQRSTNNGASWSNINGAVNTSYTTGSLTAAYNGYQYRCVVTNYFSGTSAEKNSDAAILTVNPAAVAPTIQTQPANATRNIGQAASFTIVATTSDSGTLTYQWQRSTNGGISWNSATGTGATSASYTTNALSAANNNNRYRCVVTNSKNGTTAYTNSAAVHLTMNPAAVAPTIHTQPANATKNIGEAATFTITATASDSGTLTYQWQRSTNGGISWSSATGTGVTSASYTTDTLSATNNGNRFRCVVTNSKNGTTAYTNSAAAILTMNPAAVAPVINTQPQNATKMVGETATFATAATASDSGSLTYQWQKSTDNGSSWSNMSGENSASYATGVLTLAENGNQYRCVVTNSKNGTSAVVNSIAALLTVNPAPIVNQPPTAKNPLPVQNVAEGQTTSFTAADIAEDSDDGDVLTIAGIATDPATATATASVNNGTVTITGKGAGSTAVTVTVSDGTDTAQVSVPIAVSATQTVNNNESTPDKYVKEQYIVNSTDAVAVDLTQGSDTLSAAQIHALTLLNASKPIVLTGNGYTITFKPGTIRQTTTQTDCDLGLSFNTGADYSSIQSIAGEGILLMLDFQHSGPLPGEAEVRVHVGTQYRGKMLYYYFFNPATGMLEYRQSATVGSDGMVTLTQSSCSAYILSVRAPLGTEYPDDIPLTGDRTDAALAITLGTLLALLCLGFFARSCRSH